MSSAIEFKKGEAPPLKFCASPWVEGVLTLNGDFKACCKNPTDFGSWKVDGVAKVWLSEKYQAFRQSIANGNYPDAFCESCCLNGSSQSLRQLIQKPLQEYANSLKACRSEGIYHIGRIRDILEKPGEDQETKLVLSNYRSHLELCNLLIKEGKLPHTLEIVIAKLGLIGKIVEDFLSGNVAPTTVAPLRQGNLIAICNARCIHCPGLFNEEIIKGKLMPDRLSRFKEMSESDVEKSFEKADHIIDFFMNGSEFLFSKNWPVIADRLKKQGVRVRVSTNGMLLNEKNARALIDNEYLGKLNLSLDGGTKATIERVRQRVDFDRVVENISFLLSYAASKNYLFTFSMSFALMDINYSELPSFVELAEQFHKINPKIRPSIMVQPLARKGVKEYRDFVVEHHPSAINKEELDAIFKVMDEKSKATGIQVFVFFTWSLTDFISNGCPIPSSEVIVNEQSEFQLED